MGVGCTGRPPARRPMKFRSDMTVQLVKHDASDADVAKAARVSTIGAEAQDDGRPVEGLINFLMRDRHGSPFEHNSMTFLISAPIFVAREFMRHRVWSYNEESARYREIQPVFYVPDQDRHLVQVGKPGAYTVEAGTLAQHDLVERDFYSAYTWAYQHYTGLLERGIAREVARSVLPVGIFTSFYATCNARSLMHFLSLRTERKEAVFPSFPQREIEMVAEGMEQHFQTLMPITYDAFTRNGRIAP
ncbi:FAD-dependent thymidylate synthase [Streptomyces sp. NPDC058861]|uniref:FAD-dependent thymidylate synthase n=1 Tax=Streptomyces sp. NPDC058861 TaxID=3346653 RepID=UPI0036988D0F